MHRNTAECKNKDVMRGTDRKNLSQVSEPKWQKVKKAQKLYLRHKYPPYFFCPLILSQNQSKNLF